MMEDLVLQMRYSIFDSLPAPVRKALRESDQNSTLKRGE